MAYAPSYIEQFAVPFALDPATGIPKVVEQDSPAEIGGAINNIMVCPEGAAVNNPNFGIPVPLFDLLDIDTAAIVAAIQTLEPRATTDVVQETIEQVTHPQQVFLNVDVQVSDGFQSSVNSLPEVVAQPSSAPTGPTGPSGPTGPTGPGGSPPAPVTPPIIT